MRRRRIGVVTVGRSDYGIYLPILKRIHKERRGLELGVFVGGMHLEARFGRTVRTIEADGFPVVARVHMDLGDDTPAGIARSMGLGVAGFARAFQRWRPDILLVLGDRFEMYCAAVAALPFKIPVAHIHGGELTQGALDDALRHSITKLSHLHLVATREYARRVIQMGEEPWRVTVCGAPSLDNVREMRLLTKAQLEKQFGLDLTRPPLLVTFHPVTLEYEQTGWQVRELLAALEQAGQPVVFTAPNADTANRRVRRALRAYVRKHPEARFVESLGTQAYFSLMAYAAAMVGNSSSGLIEAPSFKLPVVNVGTRQEGRVRASNVIDVGYRREEVLAGIREALSPVFRRKLRRLANPYGDGHAAERIVSRLRQVALDDRLLRKRFHDVPFEDAVARDLKSCVILGGGGHAKMVIEAMRASGVAEPVAVLDASSKVWKKRVSEVPILGNDRLLPKLARQGVKYFAIGVGTVGDSGPRRRLFQKARRYGLKPLTVVHPSATVSPSAALGAGCQVLPRAVVNAGAKVGRNAIINTGAIVEHDCVIGDHAHVATGAKLAGGVCVGAGALVGAGAVVRQGVKIGAGAVVGAGSVVVEDVPPEFTVVGVPARVLKRR